MKKLILILTVFLILLGFAGATDNIEKAIYATSPVPEPGSMLLLGIGLIGISAIARKNFIK